MLEDVQDRKSPRGGSPAGRWPLLTAGVAALSTLSFASCDLARPAPSAADVDVQMYRLRARHTLHLRRRSGDDTMRMGWDVLAAYQQITPDSAHGWIEEANGFLAMGGRRVESEADFLIRRPFVLRRDDRGFLRSVTRPDVPDQLPPQKEFMRGLGEMFENFVPPLPEGGLAPGKTWSDTLRIVRTANRPGPQTYVQSSTYRVVGDTVLSDVGAFVIDYEGAIVREDAPGEDRQTGRGTIIADSSLVTLSMSGRVEGVLRGAPAAGAGADSIEVEVLTSAERISP